MLTDAQCRNATCPPDKRRARFSDSGGLYLEVSTAGSKRWFLKHRIAGVEKQLSLGSYPDVALTAARKARDAAKLKKSDGLDPLAVRKIEKLKATRTGGDTFKAVALEWYGKQAPQWSASHAERSLRQFERDLFPWIGDRPMSEIHPMELLAALQKVEERGAIETADRVLMLARQVWDYWLPTATVQQRNITEGLKGRLTPYRGKTFAAILDPVRMGGLMRAIKGYKGGPIVRTALQLTPLLYQRPGNLRMMEWAELDLDGALWTIPSMKMKRRKLEKEQGEDHTVPLPTQAVALLRSIHPLTGHGRYVFPGERSHDRPVSDNSVRSALYALGFGKEQSWHGFRASARTMLVDELNIDYNVIEANLAHAVKDANGRSYNRTQYVKQRFVMIQQWADCHHCNSSYKGSQDPSYTPKDPTGGTVRRKVFYPFSTTPHGIELQVTLQHADVETMTAADISLSFGPASITEQIETWKDVYDIEERYRGKLLSGDGKAWVVAVLDEWRWRDESADADGRTPEAHLRDVARHTGRSPYANANFLKNSYLQACKSVGLFEPIEKGGAAPALHSLHKLEKIE